MRNLLNNKKGVTLLEGLIALVLLALVATGTFSVLLSTSRKSTGPDIQEEMALAVERAHKLLQAYVTEQGTIPTELQDKRGLCGYNDETDPLADGTHDITCLLPSLCNSSGWDHGKGSGYWPFSYTVGDFIVYEVEQNGKGSYPYPYLLLNEESDVLATSTANESRLEELSALKYDGSSFQYPKLKQITFRMTCNGFSL